MKYINYITGICIFLTIYVTKVSSQGCVDFSSNKTTLAAGSTVTFQDLSPAACTPPCPPSADQKMYTWTFDDNGNYEGISPASSDSMGPTVRYDSVGTYDVYLNVLYHDGMGGFCLDTNNKLTKAGYITVVSAPTAAPQVDFSADITYGESGLVVTFTDLSTNSPESWEWTFPGGNPVTSTQQNPVVTYNGVGVYDVSLDATNIIGTSSLTKTDYISVFGVGVEDIDSNLPIRVYPNPFFNRLNIEINKKGKDGKIEILDIIGRVLFESSMDQITQNVVIDTWEWTKGYYIVKYTDNELYYKTFLINYTD